MFWSPRSFAVVVVVIVTLAGCETATVVPPGAQQVHVDVSQSAISLDPATVHAGDVYLVVDLAPQAAPLSMVGGIGRALTDPDLARLKQIGDAEGLSWYSIDNSCCGNVHKETLSPGKYAFVLRADAVAPGTPPSTVSVLEVTP